MSRGWAAQALLIAVFSLLSLGLVEVGYRVVAANRGFFSRFLFRK